MNAQPRNGAFAIATIVLLGLTAALTLHDGDLRSAPDRRPGSPLRSTPIRTGSLLAPEPTEPRQPSSDSAAPAPTQTVVPPQRSERDASDAPAIAPREDRAATVAARSFLDGYLPYSYGRGRARRIRSAAASLLRDLEGSPPRVSEAVAGLTLG